MRSVLVICINLLKSKEIILNTFENYFLHRYIQIIDFLILFFENVTLSRLKLIKNQSVRIDKFLFL